MSVGQVPYYFLQMWLTRLDTHTKGKGKNSTYVSNLCCSFVRSFFCFLKADIYGTFSMCQALCETFYVLSHEMLKLSL